MRRLSEAATSDCQAVAKVSGSIAPSIVKVNAAWWHTPEQGANTHPELVDAFLRSLDLPVVVSVGEPKRNRDYKNAIIRAGEDDVALTNKSGHGIPDG